MKKRLFYYLGALLCLPLFIASMIPVNAQFASPFGLQRINQSQFHPQLQGDDLTNGNAVIQQRNNINATGMTNRVFLSTIIDRQPDSTNGILSVQGPTGGGVFCADYFHLDNSATVGGVIFYGFASGGDINLYSLMQGFNVYIFNHSGNIPDGNPVNPGTPILALTNITNPAAFDYLNGGFVVNLKVANGGTAVSLPAGDYWISAFPSVADDPFASGRWNWLGSSTSTQFDPVLIDPENVFGVGATNWTSIPTLINQSFPSFAWTMVEDEFDLGNCEQNFYSPAESYLAPGFAGGNKVANDIVVSANSSFKISSINFETLTLAGIPTGFTLEVFKDNGSGSVGDSMGMTYNFDNTNMVLSQNGNLGDYPEYTVTLLTPDIELSAGSTDERYWLSISSGLSTTGDYTYWISYDYLSNQSSFPAWQYLASTSQWTQYGDAEPVESFMRVRGVCGENTAINYNITTSSLPAVGGTTSGGGIYPDGSTVNLTATANAGYTFLNWQEDGTILTTNSNYSFTANGDRNLVAKFKKETTGGTDYTITTKSSPVAGGTTTGGGSYASGSSVTVKATPASDYLFESWKQGSTVVSTTKNYTFTVSANATLTAVFKKKTFTITTKSSPAVGGTTTGGGVHQIGKNLTVKATAAADYVFESWKDGATVVATTPSYSFTVSANKTLTAVFKKKTFTITTKSSPAVGGTTTGGGVHQIGKNLTVKAIAAADYVFESWKEGTTVVSTTPNFTFIVSGNRTLTAVFKKKTFTITTKSTPVAGGTTTGGGVYQVGKNLTVKATAASGYVFESWLEGTTVVSTNKNYSFVAAANRTLKAKFVKSGVSKNEEPDYYTVTDSEKSNLSEQSNEIKVYPNPITDFVTIDAGNETIQRVELYDFSGKLISYNSAVQMSKFQMDTKSVVKGTYLIKVITNKETKTIKVFKK